MQAINERNKTGNFSVKQLFWNFISLTVLGYYLDYYREVCYFLLLLTQRILSGNVSRIKVLDRQDIYILHYQIVRCIRCTLGALPACMYIHFYSA